MPGELSLDVTLKNIFEDISDIKYFVQREVTNLNQLCSKTNFANVEDVNEIIKKTKLLLMLLRDKISCIDTDFEHRCKNWKEKNSEVLSETNKLPAGDVTADLRDTNAEEVLTSDGDVVDDVVNGDIVGDKGNVEEVEEDRRNAETMNAKLIESKLQLIFGKETGDTIRENVPIQSDKDTSDISSCDLLAGEETFPEPINIEDSFNVSLDKTCNDNTVNENDLVISEEVERIDETPVKNVNKMKVAGDKEKCCKTADSITKTVENVDTEAKTCKKLETETESDIGGNIERITLQEHRFGSGTDKTTCDNQEHANRREVNGTHNTEERKEICKKDGKENLSENISCDKTNCTSAINVKEETGEHKLENTQEKRIFKVRCVKMDDLMDPKILAMNKSMKPIVLSDSDEKNSSVSETTKSKSIATKDAHAVKNGEKSKEDVDDYRERKIITVDSDSDDYRPRGVTVIRAASKEASASAKEIKQDEIKVNTRCTRKRKVTNLCEISSFSEESESSDMDGTVAKQIPKRKHKTTANKSTHCGLIKAQEDKKCTWKCYVPLPKIEAHKLKENYYKRTMKMEIKR